jgi:hypothetical protein
VTFLATLSSNKTDLFNRQAEKMNIMRHLDFSGTHDSKYFKLVTGRLENRTISPLKMDGNIIGMQQYTNSANRELLIINATLSLGSQFFEFRFEFRDLLGLTLETFIMRITQYFSMFPREFHFYDDTRDNFFFPDNALICYQLVSA